MEQKTNKTPVVPDELQRNYDSWHFSPAVESNGFLFFSGCTSAQPDGSVSPDPATQFRHAFEKVFKTLSHAGLGFESVVEMTTYHVGLSEHLEAFKAVKDEFISEPYPAWTAIGISELAAKNAIIEIRIIARKEI